jgi:lipoic acid synthetase
MGPVCSRACRYCAVIKGTPEALNEKEPENIAAAAQKLNLNHVVLTSVTRDDLNDGGGAHFAATVAALRRLNPQPTIETLIPDFPASGLLALMAAAPEVINHNIETVERLFSSLRPRASFKRSLAILQEVAENGFLTKSGFMVGLGESHDEVLKLLKTLADSNVDIVTIGQYLPPSPRHHPAARYVPPEEFAEFATAGREMGLKYVFAAPLVRSSYLAEEVFFSLKRKN